MTLRSLGQRRGVTRRFSSLIRLGWVAFTLEDPKRSHRRRSTRRNFDHPFVRQKYAGNCRRDAKACRRSWHCGAKPFPRGVCRAPRDLPLRRARVRCRIRNAEAWAKGNVPALRGKPSKGTPDAASPAFQGRNPRDFAKRRKRFSRMEAKRAPSAVVPPPPEARPRL